MWFKDFIARFNTKNKASNLETQQIIISQDDTQKIMLTSYCMLIVAGYIANTISQCEFKTYRNGKEQRKEEYYLLNYQPNKNQNAREFWYEVIIRLLYFREVLIFPVVDELFIAESFSHEIGLVKQDVFTNISARDLSLNRKFQSDEVIYLNLQNNNTSTLLTDIVGKYTDLISEADTKFVNNDSLKGILEIPSNATGSADFQQKLEKLMNTNFKNFFYNKNAVLPLTNGMKYNKVTADNKKTTGEINDRELLFNSAIKRVSQAYYVPATLITGENTSTISEIYDNYISVCVKPLANLISSEITRKRYKKTQILNGCYCKIDISGCKYADILSYADSISKLSSTTMFDINEVRNRFGYCEKNENTSEIIPVKE